MSQINDFNSNMKLVLFELQMRVRFLWDFCTGIYTPTITYISSYNFNIHGITDGD